MSNTQENDTLQVDSALMANVIAEAAGIIHDGMDRDKRLEAMYAHGLRFTPKWLLEPEHPIQDEEVEFFAGSCLTEHEVEQAGSTLPEDKRVKLSSVGRLPLYAVYDGDPLRLQPGTLVVSDEIKAKAKEGLKRIYKPGDRRTSYNGLLAVRILDAINAQDEPDIKVSRVDRSGDQLALALDEC